MYWSLEDVELKFFNKESGEPIQQGVILPKKKDKDIIDMNQLLEQYTMLQLDNGVKKYPVQNCPDQIQVENNSIIKLQYEQRKDGELLDYNKANIHKINLNTSNPIIPGLKTAFLSMRKKEVAWFLIDGYHYKITMIDVQEHKTFDPKSVEGKLQQVENYRIQGGQDFAQKNYNGAKSKFLKAINTLKHWPKTMPIDKKQLKDLLILFQGNLSQVLIELKQYENAIHILNDIKDLMRESQYEVKNYYRLAKCYYLIHDREQAIQTIKQCKQLCELDTDQESTYIDLETRIKKRVKHN